MKTLIALKNIRFHAAHGAIPQERIVGNSFVVNLSLQANLAIAARNDSLCDTISYAEVFKVVSREMNIPSVLIENVAYRILCALKRQFPSISEIEVTVEKLRPPIQGADMDSASVTMAQFFDSTN